MSAFEFSQRCPHVCWLGINPGVTRIEDAKALLRGASSIDQSSMISDGGVRAIWFLNSSHNQYSHISISANEDVVASMALSSGTRPFRLGDIIGMLGEPDAISIRLVEAPDARYLEYIVFYQRQKAAAWVTPGSRLGPDPQDSVAVLLLNTEFGGTGVPTWLAAGNETRRPWFGYGHFEEYMPGETPPPLYQNPLAP